METLGQRILFLRREILKTTQKAMAKQVGVTHSYISQIEHEKNTNPSDQFFIGISRAFNISEQWLRHGEGAMRADSCSTDLEYLKNLLADMSKNKIQLMHIIADMPDKLLDPMIDYLRNEIQKRKTI